MKSQIVVPFLLAVACSHGTNADVQVAAQGSARDSLSGRPTIPAATKTWDVSYGTFEAPESFTLNHTGTIDSYMGTLTRKSDGFTIHFDIGTMAGTRVTWVTQNRFTVFRLHTVNDNFAYTGIERVNGKQIVSTTICDWCERTRRFLQESEAIPGLPSEQREAKYRDLNERRAQTKNEHPYPANFWAEFTRDEDLVEFMLIANSYRPKMMPTLPSIIGDVSALREPNGPFAFGAATDGVSIGIWNESPQYRVNHPINVWISLRNTSGRALATNDSLLQDGFLYITTPAGGVSAVGVAPPKAGSSSAGVSAYLHAMIREPGTYMVQWRIGPPKPGVMVSGRPAPWRLESGIVTFTVVR